VRTRLEEISTGGRKKIKDVEYVGKWKKLYWHVLREYETTRSELEIEEFMGEEEKGLELMKAREGDKR